MVPEGWRAVPRQAQMPVPRTPFLPFKVPLRMAYIESGELDEEHVWTPGLLVDRRPALGAVITLSSEVQDCANYWSQLYDIDDWEARGILHTKISVGEEKMPTHASLKLFVKVAKKLLDKTPTKLIGVHDVFSSNLTGIFVCYFLVDEIGMDVPTALHAFAASRPPGMYDPDLIRGLFELFGEETPSTMPPPPPWDPHFAPVTPPPPSLGLATNPTAIRPKATLRRGLQSPSALYARPENREPGASRDTPTPRATPATPPRPTAAPSAPLHIGVTVRSPHRERILGLAREIVQPGAGAASPLLSSPPTRPLTLADLTPAFASEYLVTWKPVCERLLLLVLKEGTFVVDVNERLAHVPLRHVPRELLNSAFEGELVLDALPGHSAIPRFLVTDLVSLAGAPLRAGTPLPKRVALVQTRLLGPRQALEAQEPAASTRDAFRVRLKLFLPPTRVRKLRDEILPALPHGHEGLVFCPIAPHVNGPGCLLEWSSGGGSGAESVDEATLLALAD